MCVPVVVLDACVLYPAAQRDLFMWLAATGVIRAHWTRDIHTEWIRNVARDRGIDRQELERVALLMNQHADGALINRHHQYIPLFAATDADRHVAAAALAVRKQSGANVVTVITWNLRDFDRKELADHGLATADPDSYLCDLLHADPQGVTTAFERMRCNLRNPPKTAQECANTLSAQGLKRFVALLSDSLLKLPLLPSLSPAPDQSMDLI